MEVEAPRLGTGRTGGREATTGVIPGKYALSVGLPDLPTPQGWKWTELKSIAQLESGHTPSRRHPEYWGGGIPWIGIKDAVENHGTKIHDTFQYVTQLGLDNSSARLLPANTVCLSRTASVGYVCVMGKPMATSQDFVNWVCGPEIDPHFLKYVLVLENEALWRFASGTTHQTIYYPEAKAFHVCLPPFEEQKRITHILGTLDDKIELNRRMNATLEAMAQALYQSWFVDFDPVRRNAEGGAQRPEDTLFPDSFENSVVGEIPRGWTVERVGDVVDCVGGGTPSTKEPKFWEDGVHHWTTPKDFSSLQSPILIDTSRKLTNAGIAKISSGLLPAGTLLLSSRAPVGYLAISAIPVAINQGFIAMKCNERASNYFMLNWCQSNMGEIKSRATGTTFPEISKNSFRPISVVLPPKELMAEFTAKVAPLYAQVTANLHQSRTLAALRDTLLPNLLAGVILISKV